MYERDKQMKITDRRKIAMVFLTPILAVIVLAATSGNIQWTQLASSARHGTDAYGQSSDGTGTSTHVAVFDSNGGLTDGGAPAGSLTLQTNSVNNSTQTGLNLVNGTGCTLTNTSGNTVSVACPTTVPGVTLTTGSSATLTTPFTYNQEATAAQAITYTLPTASAGAQYCVANSQSSGTPTTGTLKVATSASGQYIDVAGTLSASGGYVISAGAAGDGACFVGESGTVWYQYSQSGTWVTH
jgi:hypothetical protein